MYYPYFDGHNSKSVTILLTKINGAFNDPRTKISWSSYLLKIPFIIMRGLDQACND